MLLASTRPPGQRPRPWMSQPRFSPHPHTSARSAHTLLPLPSRPLAHTYLCARHQNMTPVESFTPRGPPAPSMPPGAQAALPSPPLCSLSLLLLLGAGGEADPVWPLSWPLPSHLRGAVCLPLLSLSGPGSLLSHPLPGASPLPVYGLSR